MCARACMRACACARASPSGLRGPVAVAALGRAPLPGTTGLHYCHARGRCFDFPGRARRAPAA
eukprot:8010236-Alexandrium_andersonii.AAC.1